MFHVRNCGELVVLQSDLFPLNIRHAFATRRTVKEKNNPAEPGSVNFRIDSLPETARWWKALRDSLFSPEYECYVNTQVHGGNVSVIDFKDPGGEEKNFDGFRIRILGEADGIIKPFSRRKVFLGITSADCLPCLIHDTNSGAAGVVHSGWRSLVADIPYTAVMAFHKNFGSGPKDLQWAIGPSIDGDHYEVGPEVIGGLETAGYSDDDWKLLPDGESGWRPGKGDRYMLSLSRCINARLLKLGVLPENINVCQMSTFRTKASLYSYRRDGCIEGLQASVIG